MLRIILLGLFFLYGALQMHAQEFTDYQLALRNAKEVKHLDLSNQSLDSNIPWEKFKQLEVLNLSNTGLSSVPKGLENCPLLKALYLDGNIFEDVLSLFHDLSKLSLKTLSLSSCKLVFIPSAITTQKELEYIDLSNNAIHLIPQHFGSLSNLKEVSFAHNRIDTIPVSWLNLENLERINFSFNPSLEQRSFFQVASTFANLHTVTLQGMDTIKKDISYLKHIENLDISYGSFKTVPTSIIECKALKKLRFINHYADWGKVFESLATMTQLEDLEIGGCSFDVIPFNLFKIKKLQKLTLSQSIITRIPNSISRSPIRHLVFNEVGFKQLEDLWGALQNAKIEQIDFIGVNIPNSTIAPKQLKKLHRISIFNSDVSSIKLEHEKGSSWKNLSIVNSMLQYPNWQKLKKENPHLNIEWENRSTIVTSHQNHQINRLGLPIGKLIRKTVYGQVGLLIDVVNDIQLHIPPKSFLDTTGNILREEVDVHIHWINEPIDYAVEGFNFQTKIGEDKYASVQPKFILKVVAFQGGKQVKINPEYPLEVKIEKQTTPVQLFYYNDGNQLLSLESNMLDNDRGCKDNFQNDFLAYVSENWESRPRMNNMVRTSKIFISLKKYSKKRSFFYFIEPEYGFNEKQIMLLGNKIKAYPEFRFYRNIRWNYVGKNQEVDFENIFMLSEKADKSQIRKRSSFKVYVMTLEDIQLYPSLEEDHYIMQFSRGFDTLKLAVMPQLPVTKATKIQKWHKRKYVKYLNSYKKRVIRWHELDSVQNQNFMTYEFELNAFRNKLVKDFSERYKGNEKESYQQYMLYIGNSEFHLVGHFDPVPYDVIEISELKNDVVYLINTASGTITQNDQAKLFYKEGSSYLWIKKLDNRIEVAMWNGEEKETMEWKGIDIANLNYKEIIQAINAITTKP